MTKYKFVSWVERNAIKNINWGHELIGTIMSGFASLYLTYRIESDRTVEMNQKKIRPPNWIIGLILALLFIIIFAIALIGFIVGFEAAPPLKKIVAWTTTIVAGAIGFFLISAALIDVVKALVKKSLYKKESK